MGVAGVMVLEEERGRQKALGEQKKLNIDGGGGGNISRRPSSPTSCISAWSSWICTPRLRESKRNVTRARKLVVALGSRDSRNKSCFPFAAKQRWKSGWENEENRNASHRRRSIENCRKGIRLNRSPSAVRPHLCTLPSSLSLSITSGEFPTLLAFANPHTCFKRCY